MPLLSVVVLTLVALTACVLGVPCADRTHPSGQARSRVYETYSLYLASSSSCSTLFQSSRENARVERALRLDIAARERAERELAESRQAAINAAKMAALGEMSASVAHEVNNPLTVDLAARAAPRHPGAHGDDGRRRPCARRRTTSIGRSSGSVASSTRSAPSRGRGTKTHCAPSCWRRIVEDTVELCAHRFRQRGVELRVDAIPDGLLVECRGTQVTQVLLNLLSNAYDAVENQDERWVRITVEAKDGEVQIGVLDSGPGVPAEIAARIMEPFYTTKEIGRGTGLGLSLSKGIAEAHGGRLELDPHARPTRFVLTLQRAA